MKNINDLLSLGTIVLIKDNIAPYMVAGYKIENDMFDAYYMIPFPYGILTDKGVLTFKHDEVEEIFFEGYKIKKD